MKIKLTPEEIWKEYQTGMQFKSKIGLFEQVEINRNFYASKQWEGVNAPDIEKPIINVIKQIINYFISMLVSDDIGVSCEFPDGMDDMVKQAFEFITSKGIEQVFEKTKFKQKCRWLLKDAGVDGDAFFHWWYDMSETELENESELVKEVVGKIALELLDNTSVYFGNPASHVVEEQPFIICIAKLPTEDVKDMAKSDKEAVLVVPDGEQGNKQEADSFSSGDYTTVLTKLYREKGSIWMVKSTEKVVLDDPVDLGLKLYPIVKMTWEPLKDSYHGVSPVTGLIQNQIMINKAYMLFNEWLKKMGFPKIIFDRTMIKEWSNKIQAIGVNGNPNEAIMTQTPVTAMSNQAIEYISNLIEMTKTMAGVYDVALGDAKPDNTSAIIALQKTASQPLELQKLDYYQAIEDSIRIIVDIMRSSYGIRKVPFQVDDQEGMMDFDFSLMSYDDFGMVVEVGSSAYWSEFTQIQTLDNMLANGVIPDAITYLEQLPPSVVKNRGDIIKAIRAKQAQEQMMMDEQQAMNIAMNQSAPTKPAFNSKPKNQAMN